MAKQVLQLGMGDAFDDWLIEKIQLLRRGSAIASVINRIEQVKINVNPILQFLQFFGYLNQVLWCLLY